MLRERLDHIMIFLSTLSYMLFDREGYLTYFYFVQAVFYGYYFLFVYRREIKWKKDTFLIKTYFLFGAFALASVLWSTDINETFSKSRTIFLILINLMVTYDYLSKTQSIRYLLLAIIATTYINLLILLKILPDSEVYWDSWRFQGTRDNPNYLAVLQLVSMFSAIILKKLYSFKNVLMRLLINLSIFASSYVVFMTASKKGIFFCGVFILYIVADYFIITKLSLKKIAVFVALFVGLSYYSGKLLKLADITIMQQVVNRLNEFISQEGTSTTERISFINSGVNNFLENPIIGTGVSTLKRKLGTYSHSNFIEILSGLGVIGFVIYYIMYLKLFTKVFKHKVKELKILFLIFILSLLTLDIAQVTYYYKFSILILIFTAFIIENSDKTNSIEQNEV